MSGVYLTFLGLSFGPPPPIVLKKGIFAFGYNGAVLSTSNLVSNLGVVQGNVTGVGTARRGLAAASFGGDRAIFGFGYDGTSYLAKSNLVSNAGVVGSDQTTATGTARRGLAAASFGGDRAIFGFGYDGTNYLAKSNLVSNTGVVAIDVTVTNGLAMANVAACSYGGDKAIFAFGRTNVAFKNAYSLVSNLGIIAATQQTAGSTNVARDMLAASAFGNGEGIFAFGYNGSTDLATSNKVSNAGVIASNGTAVGTARSELAGASYG